MEYDFSALAIVPEKKHADFYVYLHCQDEQKTIGNNWRNLLRTIDDPYFAERKSQHLVPTMIYQVYVIELSKQVFTENTKFRAANPQFNGVLECLYVGMTSKAPIERFRQHKTGYINKKGRKLSAYIVQKYGAYLRPSLYNHINLKPMTRQQALNMEEKLAWDLRRQGYAVWFNWKLSVTLCLVFSPTSAPKLLLCILVITTSQKVSSRLCLPSCT